MLMWLNMNVTKINVTLQILYKLLLSSFVL